MGLFDDVKDWFLKPNPYMDENGNEIDNNYVVAVYKCPNCNLEREYEPTKTNRRYVCPKCGRVMNHLGGRQRR